MVENMKCSETLANETKLTESTLKMMESKDSLFTSKESEIIPDKLKIIEENLMFDYKPVSAFKLYYYISGKNRNIFNDNSNYINYRCRLQYCP